MKKFLLALLLGISNATVSYRRIRKVGKGANAEAWSALDESGEEVVLKCAKTEIGASELETEFNMMSIIHKIEPARFPVPISFVTADCPENKPGIVMEMLGKDLSRIPADFVLTLKRISVIGLFMMDTLDIIHDAGYTHGDAHAGNWLLPVDVSFSELLTDGEEAISLKLIDFGTVVPLTEEGLVKDYDFVIESMTLLSGWATEDESIEGFQDVFSKKLNREGWRDELKEVRQYLETLAALY